MESRLFILGLVICAANVAFTPVSAQIAMPCTPSMITTFSPCLAFVTNSTGNANATASPTSDCCNSLKSLMSSGKDCLCMIATGSVPFRIPINQTQAVSLPRACNMPGVPLQCKAAGAPAPAPMANGPSLSPAGAPSPSVAGLAPPEPLSPKTAPGGDETPTPPAPTTAGGAPTGNSGSRAGVTPSAAQPSYRISPLHLMIVLGAIALKY